jgi:hypothetical protein
MPDGHFAIFKSVEGRHMKNCVRENGSVDFQDLVSNTGTDLCPKGGLYFTRQLWVVEAYSKLIGDACSVADRRTIELHVPLPHLKEIKVWELPEEEDGKTQTLVATQHVWWNDNGIADLEEAVDQKAYIRPREKGPVEVGESRNDVKLA